MKAKTRAQNTWIPIRFRRQKAIPMTQLPYTQRLVLLAAQTGPHRSVFGSNTMKQSGRSRVQSPMRSLNISIDLPAVLWAYSTLSF